MKTKSPKTKPIVPITKKALDSFRNKQAAFDAGVNAGIEHAILKMEWNDRSPVRPEPKWKDVGERFWIAGTHYHDAGLIVGGLKPGTTLRLVGEPSNQFDSRAVRIQYNEFVLGYIPRDVGIPRTFPTVWTRGYCYELNRCGYKLVAVVTKWVKTQYRIEIEVQIKQTTTCPRKEERQKDVTF